MKAIGRFARKILALRNPRHRHEVIRRSTPGEAHPFEILGSGPDDRATEQPRAGDASLIEATRQMRKTCDSLIGQGRIPEAKAAAREFIERPHIDSVNTGDVGALRAIAQLPDEVRHRTEWGHLTHGSRRGDMESTDDTERPDHG